MRADQAAVEEGEHADQDSVPGQGRAREDARVGAGGARELRVSVPRGHGLAVHATRKVLAYHPPIPYFEWHVDFEKMGLSYIK